MVQCGVLVVICFKQLLNFLHRSSNVWELAACLLDIAHLVLQVPSHLPAQTWLAWTRPDPSRSREP